MAFTACWDLQNSMLLFFNKWDALCCGLTVNEELLMLPSVLSNAVASPAQVVGTYEGGQSELHPPRAPHSALR